MPALWSGAHPRTFSFTRTPGGPATDPQIFLATRPNLRSPFGTPTQVTAATGFVEAATFTPDGGAIYFHHKVGDHYRIVRLPIYRAFCPFLVGAPERLTAVSSVPR